LDADMLVILTAINKVKINFGKENEKSIDGINVNELKKLMDEGHFHKGSMLPKVTASIRFVEQKVGRIAIIADLAEAAQAVNGKTGTIIHN